MDMSVLGTCSGNHWIPKFRSLVSICMERQRHSKINVKHPSKISHLSILWWSNCLSYVPQTGNSITTLVTIWRLDQKFQIYCNNDFWRQKSWCEKANGGGDDWKATYYVYRRLLYIWPVWKQSDKKYFCLPINRRRTGEFLIPEEILNN